MPRTVGAKRNLRIARRRAVRNQARWKIIELALKDVKRNKDATRLAVAQQAIDKAVKYRLITQARGGRLKSQLNKTITR